MQPWGFKYAIEHLEKTHGAKFKLRVFLRDGNRYEGPWERVGQDPNSGGCTNVIVIGGLYIAVDAIVSMHAV